MIKILLLTLSIAQAGWWQDFCSRYLVMNDPYQFEHVSLMYLLRERDRYMSMDQLSYQDDQMLRIILDEIKRRIE